jgi:peptidoglycan/LPS O-acetylase OafA/YrhL
MRIKSLDGIRGLAAFVVMLSHLADTAPAFFQPHPPFTSIEFWTSPFAVLKYTPLRILVAGRAAVLIFFVLSGFVLYLSVRQGNSYGSYLTRRATRIYLPFAFSIFFAAILYTIADPKVVASLSDWVNFQNWTDAPTLAYLASNLLMSGVPEFPTLNSPSWSLVHEMRISIIFPLLVILLGYHYWGTIAVATIVSASALAFPFADPIAYTIELSIGYVCFFVAGAALAMRAREVVGTIKSLPNWLVMLLWLLAGTLLISPMNYNLNSLAPGLGAVLLISLCISSQIASRFLESGIAMWLGRISYSLYLIHVPIILAVLHLGAGQLPLPVLWMIAVGISLPLAEICNRTIEQPAIRLGRKLAGKLDGSGRPAPAVSAPVTHERRAPRLEGPIRISSFTDEQTRHDDDLDRAERLSER